MNGIKPKPYEIRNAVNFLFLIATFRYVVRSWRQMLGPECENDTEHTFRVEWIARVLAMMHNASSADAVDLEVVGGMALVHDIPELLTLDGSPIHRPYLTQDEVGALRDMLAKTGMEAYFDLFQGYKRRDTIEAKIVKDADNLAVEFELKELEYRGHRGAAEVRTKRIHGRDELFTDAARELFDELQRVSPGDWHMDIREEIVAKREANRTSSK